MDHIKLRSKIENEIKPIPSEEWFRDLDKRKLVELDFHNSTRDYSKNLRPSNKKYYQTTSCSKRYVDEWIAANSPNLVFLDYACGDGQAALLAAKNHASLSIGLDISDVSLHNAEQMANRSGLKNCCFVQGDCEATKLPSNSIDRIICRGMLHHLDLDIAFPELQRILKPGGIILAVEALNYNPFIKIYRYLTPHLRTEWEAEHILSLKDLKKAQKYFNVSNLRFWHITSYVSAIFVGSPKIMKISLKVFDFIDSILCKIPIIQLLSWQFTFELRKREN